MLFFDGFRRKHFYFARLRAAGGKGRCVRERPLLSSVRNIKSASSLATSPPCHFVTFPLSINGEGEIMVAFDLLTGLYIRAIHRMALIPAPRRHRVVGEVLSQSRRPAAVMLNPRKCTYHVLS